MRKRILTGILLAALTMAVTACGSSEVKEASGVDADVSVTETEDTVSDGEETEEKNTSSDTSVTLEETEIYNADGVVVTVTGFDGGLLDEEVNLSITNDSETNILLTTSDLVVNGYMLSSSGLYSEVAAGKAANDSISLYSSDLSACGIDTVATIEFALTISDDDTWETIAESERIVLNTSAADGFTQSVDDSGDVIYDSNDVRVICKGLKEDSIWDGELVIYAENNSDRSVSIYSEDVSVNGYMEDESFWIDLYQGTKAVDGMYLLDLEDLNLESVDDVEEIAFSLVIVDEDTWDTIDTSDVITLSFDAEE
ncbi:MAG: hypothetical protein LUE92_08095 [Clostridiales bacterium]|nr:hypothetical protein [Clostridiales bacterium]